ncbi:hypothetical protein EUTSA_v10011008mg, partial [Eutrema salsugineum]
MRRKGNKRRLKRARRRRKLFTTPYIPLDLQINILLRLPVKSLSRFRWVSKLWNQHLNFASSSAPGRLLIAFEDFHQKKLLLVSLPNPHASSSYSYCVPYRDLRLRKFDGRVMYNPVHGLICVGSRLMVEIFNPITRQLQAFPQDDPKGHDFFFGYDPIEDQYKVLAIDESPLRAEHKVLVVGRDRAWRDPQCVACPHVSHTTGLYMNGTVYYGASTKDIDSPNNIPIIMSFNVRFETFNIIKLPSEVVPMGIENMWTDKPLINYRGKLGVVKNPRNGYFRMWVLEDAEKEEWSMNTFQLPGSAAAVLDFKVMATFSNGEICLVPRKLSDPF